MQAIITGGSGFVGQVLSRRLLDQGYAVTALGTRPTLEMPHPNFHRITSYNVCYTKLLRSLGRRANPKTFGRAGETRWGPRQRGPSVRGRPGPSCRRPPADGS